MKPEESLPAAENWPPVTEEQIRTLAYDLWERDDSAEGRPDEYWEKARRQLLADDAPLQPSQGDPAA